MPKPTIPAMLAMAEMGSMTSKDPQLMHLHDVTNAPMTFATTSMKKSRDEVL